MHLLNQLENVYSLRLKKDQKAQVRLYLDLLQRWNRRMGLSSVQREEEYLRFHLFEAFWAAKTFLEPHTAVADIGSGAGFPGLAMKLYRPSLQITLLEKSYKKATFLQQASRLLNVDVEVFQGRAEIYPSWDRIGIAVIRALKPSKELLAILSYRALPLLCFHGRRLPLGLQLIPLLRQKRVPESKHRHISLLSFS